MQMAWGGEGVLRIRYQRGQVCGSYDDREGWGGDLNLFHGRVRGLERGFQPPDGFMKPGLRWWGAQHRAWPVGVRYPIFLVRP